MSSHLTPSRAMKESFSLVPSGPEHARGGTQYEKGTIDRGLKFGGTHATSGNVSIMTGSDTAITLDLTNATTSISWPDGIPTVGPTVLYVVLSFGDVDFDFSTTGATSAASRSWNCNTNGDLVIPALFMQANGALVINVQPTSGNISNGEYGLVIL